MSLYQSRFSQRNRTIRKYICDNQSFVIGIGFYIIVGADKTVSVKASILVAGVSSPWGRSSGGKWGSERTNWTHEQELEERLKPVFHV